MTQTVCFEEARRFLAGLFEGDLHAERVLSSANATLGVLKTASLAVHAIGQRLAVAPGRMAEHALPLDVLPSGKQVDQLLFNQGIDIDAALYRRVQDHQDVWGARVGVGYGSGLNCFVVCVFGPANRPRPLIHPRHPDGPPFYCATIWVGSGGD